MIRITDDLSLNPAYIASMYFDRRHYMNGSETVLVIRMEDGKEHRIKHGYGVDIYEIEKKLAA